MYLIFNILKLNKSGTSGKNAVIISTENYETYQVLMYIFEINNCLSCAPWLKNWDIVSTLNLFKMLPGGGMRGEFWEEMSNHIQTGGYQGNYQKMLQVSD